MKSYHLSKIVGAGVFLASLAILPLAKPASAQADPATFGRSELNSKWMSAYEFYWLGRHEWRGDGVESQLRNTGAAYRRSESLTNPNTGTGNTIIERRDTTIINPGTRTTPDTTIINPGTTTTPDTTTTPGTTITPRTP